MDKIKVEGKYYIKASKAEIFALVASKGDSSAPTTFFLLDRANMLEALESCPELFARNSENTLVWKGLTFINVCRAFNANGIRFAKIPCQLAKSAMKLDRNGTRATTQEKFIAEFFGGRHIGGLRNSGGIVANDSGKIGDVKLEDGRQVEVKGWSGRLAGKVSLENLHKMVKDGILTESDLIEILRGQE